MIRKPEFDIVLWGGSSFIGKLVAEHLHQTYGIDGQIRWAIGGRNKQKLEATRTSLGAGAEALSIIVGDARDRQFLGSMARNAKVVLSSVGPYALYGKELIEACAANGTDYCDLAGEIPFIQEMMDRRADQARTSGARILNCCGVDSLPSDLGVRSLNEIAQKQFGCGIAHVTNEVKSFKGRFSGGTISSLGGMRNDAARDDKVAAILDNPYAICPPDRRSGAPQPDIDAVRRSPSGAWLGPFFMAIVNTRVVHATNAQLDYPYGTDFTYNEGMDVGGRRAASVLAVVTRMFYRTYRSGLMRSLLTATVLPKPGEGPSKKAQEAGEFEFHLLARTRSGHRLTLVVSGDRDPGYGASSRMIGEVAVCLAQDLPKSALPGGFWTPAAAIANKLIPRLIENAGMKFALLTETGERCPIGPELFDSDESNAGERRNKEGVRLCE
ncbi:MAG: saccharopine dehydrogenase NADP-binding domain-containing protein [Pseudomonadota bacterium]